VLREVGVSETAIESVAAEVAAGIHEPTGSGIPADDIPKLIMAGTTDQISERVAALNAAGVDLVAGVVLGDEKRVRRTIERYARDVAGSE